jgi:hypothetical protein
MKHLAITLFAACAFLLSCSEADAFANVDEANTANLTFDDAQVIVFVGPKVGPQIIVTKPISPSNNL